MISRIRVLPPGAGYLVDWPDSRHVKTAPDDPSSCRSRSHACGDDDTFPNLRSELQRGYSYAQEFLPGNDFGTRVTVIGNRAFAYRRMNRPDDFRASGSGQPNWDPSEIDLRLVRLAFLAAQRLGTQSVAIDGCGEATSACSAK